MSLCCRICVQPLVPLPPPTHNSERKKWKRTSSISSKTTLPYCNNIVAAQCGDLFHRVCLLKHCSSVSNDAKCADPVECPACGKIISISRVRVIDFAPHEGYYDKFSKDIRYLEMMRKELEGQFQDTLIKCENTKKMLNELTPIVKDLQTCLENRQVEAYKRFLLADTKQAISGTQKALNIVQEYNIILVRDLLSTLKEYSSSVISAKGILPTELIPALELIKNDKTVLQKLVNIITPKQNNVPEDKLTLTAEILTTVRKASLCHRFEKFHQDLKNHVSLQNRQSFPLRCTHESHNLMSDTITRRPS